MDAVCGHLPIRMVARRGSAFFATLAERLVYAAARAKLRRVCAQWLAEVYRRAMKSAATCARLSAGLAQLCNYRRCRAVMVVVGSRSVWNAEQPFEASLPSWTCEALLSTYHGAQNRRGAVLTAQSWFESCPACWRSRRRAIRWHQTPAYAIDVQDFRQQPAQSELPLPQLC